MRDAVHPLKFEEDEEDQMREGVTCVLASFAVVVIAAYAAKVSATPASGFTATTLATGRFGEIDVHNHFLPPDFRRSGREKGFWMSLQKTKGASDLYVQSNVWAPGGTTGWHTHPGHSLITVTAGAVTVYESDDPSCTPHTYTQGMGFVDHAGDHVHVIRNEGDVEARTVAVQLIPAGSQRRVDAAGPASCPF
jgi:quercetin dioxygenase-like cupin family protein